MPEINTTPTITNPTDHISALAGRSLRTIQAISGTNTTWVFPRTVASPGSDFLDGVMPEDQVGAEKESGDYGQSQNPAGQGSVGVVLTPGQQSQER